MGAKVVRPLVEAMQLIVGDVIEDDVELTFDHFLIASEIVVDDFEIDSRDFRHQRIG